MELRTAVRLAAASLAVLTIGAAPPAQMALHASAAVPPPQPEEHLEPPPADACARLGYGGGRASADASASYAPPSAVARTGAANEVVVTGFRLQAPPPAKEERRMAREARPSAPPPPAPPPPPPPPLAMAAPMASSPTAAQAYPQPLPGTINRDRYPDAAPNPIRQAAAEPVSTFSIDVDTAAYSNVRRHLREGRLPPRDAVRVEELVNYFDYGYARPTSRADPFRVASTLTDAPWAEGRRLLHIGVQGFAPPAEQLAPLNLVFLVDVSGSMQGPDRLALAKRSLEVLVNQLRPQDRVAMAVYAGAAGQVLAPTPGDDKLRIRCAIQALEAGGSTAGGAGLALAYSLAEQHFRNDAVNRVILMTDGDFNVGVADPSKLEDFVAKKRKTGVYLSVYGYGAGNYNDLMMQALAQKGNGTAAYVDSLEEGRKLFRDDFGKGLFPIADDVKIQVEFNPARVAEYRLIGYETRMLAREDFNNDRVDAGEVGAGASVTALYEITPVGGPRSADPLRYGRQAGGTGGGAELAFVKLRYKRPGEPSSHLLQQAVLDRPVPLERAPEPTRWAAAVAGYGQLLKGDPRLEAGFGWERVIGLAEAAQGDDPHGLRAEFIQLAQAAKAARSLNE